MAIFKLSKIEYMWFGDGPLLRKDCPIGYEVQGMPPGLDAHINNLGAPNNNNWMILRTENGVSGERYGEFGSADEALASLEAELNR